MTVLPRVVANHNCHTGEAPLWHPDQRRLYWVDIPNAKLFSYDPASGEDRTYETGAPVGAFTTHEDGRLMLFMAEGAIKLWDDGRMETVIDGLPDEKGNRFNDVIADPEGRVFCGVMSTPERAGRLYRLDPDRSIDIVEEGTGTANGMGFSPNLDKMFFCDSRKEKMYVYDYDRGSGSVNNRKILVEPEEGSGRPDGMTVDAQGNIWSARWDGARLVQHAPDGAVLRTVEFPVKNVSCVTFGGEDYTDMYVTTAGGHNQAENGALAGALFHLNLGVKGKPEFRSRLR